VVFRSDVLAALDREELAEIELTADLIVAASEQDALLTQAQLDEILFRPEAG
jgi:hypothetical protein